MSVIKLLGKVMIAISLAVAATTTSFAAPVNVNKADAKALADNINGIGPKKAQAIVTYRETKGAFKSVNDLAKVKGIGAKIIEKNKADLRISDAITANRSTVKK